MQNCYHASKALFLVQNAPQTVWRHGLCSDPEDVHGVERKDRKKKHELEFGLGTEATVTLKNSGEAHHWRSHMGALEACTYPFPRNLLSYSK